MSVGRRLTIAALTMCLARITFLIGKTARIQMVDTKTGGWGHVLVDQIVQRPGSGKG